MIGYFFSEKVNWRIFILNEPILSVWITVISIEVCVEKSLNIDLTFALIFNCTACEWKNHQKYHKNAMNKGILQHQCHLHPSEAQNRAFRDVVKSVQPEYCYSLIICLCFSVPLFRISMKPIVDQFLNRNMWSASFPEELQLFISDSRLCFKTFFIVN